MSNPIISCILPTFNRPVAAIQRVHELIDHNDNIEVIVINDGGESINLDIANVKVIDLKINSGSVSIPRNIGITHSQGDYICHIDDDVVQYPNKVKVLKQMLDDHDTCLVFGQRHEIKNGILFDTLEKIVWEPNEPQGWGVDNGQIMYRRNVYEKIDLSFCRRACDWELAKKIRTISNKFIATKEVVCAYVWHDKNRSLNEQTKHQPIYPIRYSEYFKWGSIPDKI